ncbi:type II secretion system F family protein [Marinovum sp.]|uniref:type II secretion system F family protein n=1 Tax=Marinovum sp. TaxID=2024839 RepID=UPI003A94E62D
MTAFRYTAYTATGQRRRGTLVAETRTQANDQLRAKGLFPAEIEARAGARPLAFLRPRAMLSADERTVFTRQLEVLLSADIPVDMALETVSASGGSQRIEAVANAARAALQEGESLSHALGQSDAGFPPYFLAAIAAGETSGELSRVVNELANHLETIGQDQSRLATALIYPTFVALVSLVVCAILVTSVAPQLVSMFEATGQPLPAITVRLLAVSDWLQRNWLGCLIALVAGALAARWALRVPRLRDRWDNFLLKLPIAGRLIRNAAALQYLQTLALVISSRQTALDAVRSAERVLTIRRFQTEAQAVSTALQRGESLSRALAHLTLIPPVCCQLIGAGEQSARVAPMADRAARLVASWLETDRKRIAALMDPLLMMIVGSFVLVVVLAILLPIFDLQAMVSAPG